MQSHMVPTLILIFGVSVINTDDVTLYDACTDEMDMIGIGRILCRQYHGLIIRGHFGFKRLILRV